MALVPPVATAARSIQLWAFLKVALAQVLCSTMV